MHSYHPASRKLWRPPQNMCCARGGQHRWDPHCFLSTRMAGVQTELTPWLQGDTLWGLAMGTPYNPITRKGLFHPHPILLPRRNKQLSSQFCPPITANTQPRFQFHSRVTQQWPAAIWFLAEKANCRVTAYFMFQFLDPSHKEPREPNLSKTLTLSSLHTSAS